MSRYHPRAMLLGKLQSRAWAACVALCSIVMSACLAPTQPPPDADGRTIYELQLCRNCHGAEGEGTRRGPALETLNEHWSPERLAAFFADVESHERGDTRLAALAREHSGDMQSYANLDHGERLRLARYLLER